MGKHNRIKVQPQYGLELIWSPLAELRNKSRMSENVIELKKPNIKFMGRMQIIQQQQKNYSSIKE